MTQTEEHTIMIIDDNETNLELLYEALSQLYDVIAIADGAYAIETAKEEQPELILLDIMMPGIDGFAVCKALKTDPATTHIPIIFVSACDDQINLSKMKDAGGYALITKPIEFTQLFEIMDTALINPKGSTL